MQFRHTMKNSHLGIGALICYIWLGTAVLSSSIDDPPCKSDGDCIDVRYGIVPESNRQFCSNGTCLCKPDSFSSKTLYDIGFNYCIPNIQDTGKPCVDHSSCNPTQQCLGNGTCWECTIGRFSNSKSSLCEEPIQGDNCRGQLDIPNPFPNNIGLWSYYKPCQGEGLKCNEQGRCACDGDYFYHPDLKRCTTLPKVGEDCSFAKSCKDDGDSYGFTKCSTNGTCICTGTIKNGTNYCFQKPTGVCENDSQCSENAKCLQRNQRQCVCVRNDDDGPLRQYVDSRGGECLRYMYGSFCKSDPDFEVQKALDYQGLKCIGGVYQCARPLEQYYDNGPEGKWSWTRWRHICVIKVGGSCTGIEDTRCAEGASCVEVDGQLTCQCDPGFSSTPENGCKKHAEFEANCTADCNNFAGLVCIDGICQCPDTMVKYDAILKRCLSPEGYFCGQFPLFSPLDIQCQRGFTCKLSRGPVILGKRCLKD